MSPPFFGLTFQKLLIFSLWLTVAHYKEKHYYVGINNYLGSILTSYLYSRTAVVDSLLGPITSLNRFILPDMNSYYAASLKPHQKTIGYSGNRYATIGTWAHLAWEVVLVACQVHRWVRLLVTLLPQKST